MKKNTLSDVERILRLKSWKGAKVVGTETRENSVFWRVEHPSGAVCLVRIRDAVA